MQDTAPFGTTLRQHRKSLDLTQHQLASRVGCAVSTIVKLETDMRRPSREMAERLAEILQVPAAERVAFLQAARRSQPALADRSLLPGGEAARESAAPAPVRSRLPVAATPLIGRQGEVAAVQQLLRRPECRLLTILGPGGIGKTRLAVAAAALLPESFPDGLIFIPLAPLASGDPLAATMAEEAGLTLAGQEEPRKQLIDYLRSKKMIFILDSIEHLLNEPGVIDLLQAILETAPGLALLVTSRERLHLQREWVFEVQGLSTPPTQTSDRSGLLTMDPAEMFASVDLFLYHARRVLPAFSPDSVDLAAIARICRAVEGLPLGIELAAAWVSTLSCAEIAHEIERGIDILSISARDLPERHRSMRAVFEQSWKLLSKDEQHVMERLSLFRGSFTRRAAEQVAGAGLPLLSSLVAKSLLRRQNQGRYDLHELTCQYAGGCLKASGQEMAAQAAYVLYFMDELQVQLPRMQSGDQPGVVAELNLEIDNIRAAWDWGIELSLLVPLSQAAWTVWYYFDLRDLYREVEDMFLRAEEAIRREMGQSNTAQPGLEMALHRLRTWRGFNGIRLGHIEDKRQMLHESIAVFRQHGESPGLGDALWVYALLGWLSGDFPSAALSARESIAINSEEGRPWQVAFSTIVLGAVYHEQGRFQDAFDTLQRAVRLSQDLGVLRIIVFGLGQLIRTAQRLGYRENVQMLLREHLRLATEMKDRSAMAFGLENLAQALPVDSGAAEARCCYQEAFELYTDVGDMWSAARVLVYAGQVALAQGQIQAARENFHRALRTAVEVQSQPYAMDALTGLAEANAGEGRYEPAGLLSAFILQHPASTQTAKDAAARLQACAETRMSPDRAMALREQSQQITLEALLEQV